MTTPSSSARSLVHRIATPLAFTIWAAAFVVMAALAAPARAQEPEAPKNLKVLPKDLTRDSVVQIMRGFAAGLGVRCEFCHAEDTTARQAGPGGRVRLDFASDAKETKRKARVMLRMVDSINSVFLASLPARHDPPVTVTCITCHRGSELPRTLPAVLAETIDRAGVDSAIAQYRALRADMVSGRYDFSEISLDELAQSLARSGKPDDAIRMLQLNQEFSPNSANIDVLMGAIYQQQGNRDKAIAEYRAALTKQPNNRAAQARLRQLEGGGNE
ncbi:MAG TPA: c-type cytochrome [Gemmatimonadaceae bacterium]|nr:c-type cytochrome [Gemmatimonadaceae bacterium]